MTQNPPPHQPPSSAAGATAAVCGQCCSDDRWILHNVRHRGLYRKLCTSCVLKIHHLLFCPTCFSLHDAGGGKTLTCFKCNSLSHSTCVPPNVPKSPYLCPPCSNPNFKFFDVRKSKKGGKSNGGDCSDSKKVPEEEQCLDERAARIFLAAAKLAAISMNKAAAVARLDAERRVKEAAVARKRAKEAIDHVMALSARYSMINRRPNPNPNPNPGGARGPSATPVRVERNGAVIGRPSNGAPAAMNPPEVKKTGRPNNADGPVPMEVENGSQRLHSNTNKNANVSDKNHGSGASCSGAV